MMTGIPEEIDVVSRFQRLEAQNRWMKRLGMLTLALTGSILLMGQALPSGRIIEAERFVLVDEHGHARSELSMTRNGPRLAFLDEDGKAIVALGMGPQMIGLGLYDANGQGRALLGVASDGTPGLFLYNQDARLRIGLVAPPDRTASLGLFDENGIGRARLTVWQDGSSNFLLLNQGGTVQFKAP